MVRYPCIPFLGYSTTSCGTDSIETDGAQWTLEMSTRIRRHRLRILHVSALVSGDRLIDDREGTAMWLRIGVPFRETRILPCCGDVSYPTVASTAANPLSSISDINHLQFNNFLVENMSMRPHVTRVASCHSSYLLRKISDL